jgi:hypothetical protein
MKINQTATLYITMELKRLLLAIFFIITIVSGCKKSNENSPDSTGSFTFTKSNGKIHTVKYVNTIVPSKNGQFALQYQDVSKGGSKWMFFIYVDDNNELSFDMEFSSKIINGTSYTSNSQTKVYFNGKLDNTSLNIAKTTIIFEKSAYPGQIVATFKSYSSNNTLIGNGKFDFVVK